MEWQGADPPARWKGSEAEFLLDAERHATVNEVASALAAMRLALARRGEDDLVRQACLRLEGFGKVQRLLMVEQPPFVSPGPVLAELLDAMGKGHPGAGPIDVHLRVTTGPLPGPLVDLLLKVAHEFMTNALKCVTDGKAEFEVKLVGAGDGVVLSLSNPVSSSRRGPSSGLGKKIVERLARRHMGLASYRIRDGSHHAHLFVPLRPEAAR